MLPAAVRNASASTVRIFRGSIQSSSSRCVRFKTIVADDPATLATGRVLPPTRSTGWIAPASPGAHGPIFHAGDGRIRVDIAVMRVLILIAILAVTVLGNFALWALPNRPQPL